MSVKRYVGDKFTGLSSDSKPNTSELNDGAVFHELDTNKIFQLYSGNWEELGYGGTSDHTHSFSDITGTAADTQMPDSYNNGNWDNAYTHSNVDSGNPHGVSYSNLEGSIPSHSHLASEVDAVSKAHGGRFKDNVAVDGEFSTDIDPNDSISFSTSGLSQASVYDSNSLSGIGSEEIVGSCIIGADSGGAFASSYSGTVFLQGYDGSGWSHVDTTTFSLDGLEDTVSIKLSFTNDGTYSQVRIKISNDTSSDGDIYASNGTIYSSPNVHFRVESDGISASDMSFNSTPDVNGNNIYHEGNPPPAPSSDTISLSGSEDTHKIWMEFISDTGFQTYDLDRVTGEGDAAFTWKITWTVGDGSGNMQSGLTLVMVATSGSGGVDRYNVDNIRSHTEGSMSRSIIEVDSLIFDEVGIEFNPAGSGLNARFKIERTKA